MPTVTRGVMVGSAGIDESNGNGYYVLYPKDPYQSAKRILSWFKKSYNLKNIGIIITDSTSTPLHRGAIGFALSYAGFDPLRDYRGTCDLFGREIKSEMSNIPDSLAAAAVAVMGECDERIPVAIIRGLHNITFISNGRSKSDETYVVAPEDDIMAPILFTQPWRKGGTPS